MRSKNKDLMKSIVDFVDDTYERTGRTPTYREIGKELSMTSSCVSNYLKEMAENDLVSLTGDARGITTRKMQLSKNELINVPVIGPILNLPQFRKPKNLQTQLLMTGDRVYFFIPLPR